LGKVAANPLRLFHGFRAHIGDRSVPPPAKVGDWLVSMVERDPNVRPAFGDAGEAFTMLTMEPGPDIAPYHDR
jgi:hypothetical protein